MVGQVDQLEVRSVIIKPLQRLVRLKITFWESLPSRKN